MKRLFAAIRLSPDPEFLLLFRKLMSQLRYEKIKWVEEHNIHITVKFFGETGEEKIPGIRQMISEVAENTGVFSFSLQKLGIFGSSHDPRVIWAGIEPAAPLITLMSALRTKMELIGFEADRQNLVPHLTLGRIKYLNDKKKFQQIMEENRSVSSKEITVDRIILFESILKKEGPVYVALHSFPLRKQ